jgi:hypothetical protein
MNAFTHPTGDLAHRLAVGQQLPARLIVVAGIQMHHRPGRQRPGHGEGI